jgi:hypothetical protein
MSNSKEKRSALLNEEFLKKSANNTGSTKMETFYGSIISTMLESLKAVK